MAKKQTYSDVSLSAVEDIGSIVFNRMSQALLLSSNKNIFPFSIMRNVTRFNFCHVLKTILKS
jgi:hypothetical protein